MPVKKPVRKKTPPLPKEPVEEVAQEEKSPRVIAKLEDCHNKQDFAILLTQREGKTQGVNIAQMSEIVGCLSQIRAENPHRFNTILAGVAVDDAPNTDGGVTKPKPGGS